MVTIVTRGKGYSVVTMVTWGKGVVCGNYSDMR